MCRRVSGRGPARAPVSGPSKEGQTPGALSLKPLYSESWDPGAGRAALAAEAGLKGALAGGWEAAEELRV